uniref:MSP domain-containing protein n=1 Tax=Steinernema glaseri TaxID=37863 RepID=A0A1I7YBA7_9BILA
MAREDEKKQVGENAVTGVDIALTPVWRVAQLNHLSYLKDVTVTRPAAITRFFCRRWISKLKRKQSPRGLLFYSYGYSIRASSPGMLGNPTPSVVFRVKTTISSSYSTPFQKVDVSPLHPRRPSAAPHRLVDRPGGAQPDPHALRPLGPGAPSERRRVTGRLQTLRGRSAVRRLRLGPRELRLRARRVEPSDPRRPPSSSPIKVLSVRCRKCYSLFMPC